MSVMILAFETAEITTSDHEGKEDHNTAWIVASQGTGELETNDSNYTYKYLMMPENIMHIHQASGYTVFCIAHSDRKLQFFV